MTPDLFLGAWMLVAAILYALSGGADYGGGVWDLLASGPRQRAQRELIEEAITPVWETNHVWLIALVVLLFSGFPRAFAIVSTALHIPLTLLLIGIVARGTSFTFRTYDSREDTVQQRWGRIFAISSVLTPILLGVIVGSITTGDIEVDDGVVTSGFVRPWATDLFPWAVGLLTLSLFAYLAAVYLTLETEDVDLREDFRRRALAASISTAVLAVATLILSAWAAPTLFAGLTAPTWALGLFGLTGLLGVGAFVALLRHRHSLARAAAIGQVVFVILGWGVGQYPYLVADEVTLAEASAPANVQLAIGIAFTVGALPILIAIRYLFRVFKGRPRSHGRDI